MTKSFGWQAFASAIAVTVIACSNDYDEFEFVADDAGASGGSAGSGGGSGSGGAAGASGTASCDPGQTSCAGQCVSLDDDASHCGACGVACAAGLECGQGRCRCDSAGDCGDGDLADCRFDGRCECGSDDCRPGERCAGQGAAIQCACNGGESCNGDDWCCPSGCVDVDDDEQNCGACGRVCANGEQCFDGDCES